MKVTIYELLGMIKDESVDYEYVKYFDRVDKKDGVMFVCVEDIIYKLDHSNVELNDIVEILEEPKGIPEKLHQCYMDTDNDEIEFLLKNINIFIDRYNDLLDYLESKGE